MTSAATGRGMNTLEPRLSGSHRLTANSERLTGFRVKLLLGIGQQRLESTIIVNPTARRRTYIVLHVNMIQRVSYDDMIYVRYYYRNGLILFLLFVSTWYVSGLRLAMPSGIIVSTI